MRKLIKRVALACAVAVGVVALVVLLRAPSLDRNWDPDVKILAGVEMTDEGPVLLSGVRDWRYSRDTVTDRSYFDRAFDPADIVDMWMYEQQLDDVGLIAHTFLVFEFDESYGDARFLGLSVETRRELGETYSIVGGMMRTFEVTHIWATERDLVIRRVEYLDYPLTRYHLQLPEDSRQRIFRKFALETAGLAQTPRWYNTALNNCTSSLVKYANESRPGAIPLHYSYVLTGKMDDYLRKLGYLAPDYSLDVTREYLASSGLR